MVDQCKRVNFKIPFRCCDPFLKTTIKNITNVLNEAPFSIALDTGSFFPSTSPTINNRYYPDRADPVEDLNEGGKTFLWQQSKLKIYNKFQLVFQADERSGLKSNGDTIASFKIRVVKDPPGSSVPVGTPNPTHAVTVPPAGILGEATIDKEGPHVIDLTLPTEDCTIYVHTEYADVMNVPIGDDRIEIHGMRFDLLLF